MVVALDELPRSDMATIQRLLLKARFSPGAVDGFFGPRTLEAWASFKESVNLHDPDQITLIGPSSYEALVNASKATSGKTHDFSTVAGTIAAIRWECNHQGLVRNQTAYVLATAEWETARTFKPLEEYGKGRGRDYGRPDPITGQTYYGRGFVQLTWKANYAKYATILGIDLVGNPSLACNPNVALFILVHGMKTGAFTGRSLSQYVNGTKSDFVNARRVVNGLDKASEIAAIARKYL